MGGSAIGIADPGVASAYQKLFETMESGIGFLTSFHQLKNLVRNL
jgi:hypothetical protein